MGRQIGAYTLRYPLSSRDNVQFEAVTTILGAQDRGVVRVCCFRCRRAKRMDAVLDDDTVFEVVYASGRILLTVPASATACKYGRVRG